MSISATVIREKLRTDDKWLARALLALNARQTLDEQRAEATKYHNDVGFTAGHAKRGTGMAKFYERTGFLTARQLAWWRATTPSGRMRIEIYCAQLARIAAERAAHIA